MQKKIGKFIHTRDNRNVLNEANVCAYNYMHFINKVSMIGSSLLRDVRR